VRGPGDPDLPRYSALDTPFESGDVFKNRHLSCGNTATTNILKREVTNKNPIMSRIKILGVWNFSKIHFSSQKFEGSDGVLAEVSS
jgi:hypothetical protein